MTPATSAAEISLSEHPFDELLTDAVRFHGHLCPGQVLGVRMVQAGCRALGFELARRADKRLVVLVEIDRCAVDAIQALTGVSLGKRTLKHVDYGKMAATFVDVAADRAVRVAVRDSARARVSEWCAHRVTEREAQVAAYRVMPESDLLTLTPVRIRPGWLDRRRVRVFCAACGEGVNYEREVRRDGVVLCQSCSAEAYYERV